MLEFLASLKLYAPVISALSAFVSTGILIWMTCFRKTRREKVDDLKFAIHLLCHEEGRDWFSYRRIQKVLENLEDKFQEEKYKKLHGCAVTELEKEGTIKIIGNYDAHLEKPENFQ